MIIRERINLGHRKVAFFLLKNVGFMYAFDGAPAQDQEEDEMQDQETASDQQGDMNDPDAFIGHITRSTSFHEWYNPGL